MSGVRRVAGGRWLVRGVLATLLVVLAGGSTVGAADAHTGLEGSTPAAGATVEVLPTPVRLRFADPVLPGTAAGVLTGPDGRVTLGTPTIRGTVVTVALPRVRRAGRYVLAWRVVAEDGHPVAGTLPLVVVPAAVRVATPSGAPSVTPTTAGPSAAVAPSPVPAAADAAAVALAAAEADPQPPSSATGGSGPAWGVFALLLLLAGTLPRVLGRHRAAAHVGPGR